MTAETFSIEQLTPIFPELFLILVTFVLLMYGVFRPQKINVVNGIAIAALFLAIALSIVTYPGETTLFNGAYQHDDFSLFLKIFILLGSAIGITLSISYFEELKKQIFELPILILLATIGMMVLVSAGDLIALYMGLELMSLSLYVIASINRDNIKSTEAGLKYFVLGALSSGMLLYGASLIYGATGTINFALIAERTATEPSLLLIFGLVLVFVGLAFKVSAVPFHMWTPDVYQGAPTPITAFLAGAPKLAAMAVFLRISIEAFGNITPSWQQIIAFISIASMLLGAFAAIGQNNIKRLLAYSSIGHMGYALVGLAAGSPEGIKGVLIYLVIYLVMTVGTFACILSLRRSNGYIEKIDELSGLVQTHPLHGYVLIALMFSLAGIPPLAGFFAKFYVFAAAVEAGLYPLAIIGVIASVISAYYYLRIVKIMAFDEPAEPFQDPPKELRTIIFASAIIIICFIFYPSPLTQAAANAAQALL